MQYLSFIIEISLKFKPSLKPVPKALEKASFAANLLEKKAVLLRIWASSSEEKSNYCMINISSYNYCTPPQNYN